MYSFPRFALLSTFVLTLCSFISAADDAPANSELVVDESFDKAELGKKWHVNTGNWSIQEGVLRVSEVAADKHSAAARYAVETDNAVYQLRFRLINKAKMFHFGFDPKPGELEKKGHLFSVIVTPTSWKIMKHIDKARPKEAPNETLVEQERKFELGQWYTLRVTTWGQFVNAKIDDEDPLKAAHPTFGVKKPTLVFRCIGDGVEIDDIKVWQQNR
ncbi:MAG: hypothetical protein HKN47_04430 [Pirellulaceae bacterium]|nr:hypothetical protein [Pirellulaceae bacterium]